MSGKPRRQTATQVYEQATIDRALAGDGEAGREALDLCAHGLLSRKLSPAMADYLAERLLAYLDGGQSLDRAMCVEVERGAGRPRTHLPEWEEPIAVVAALLTKRGFRPEQLNRAMDDARELLDGKSLGRSEAKRIRDAYVQWLVALSDEDLLHLLLHRDSEPRIDGKRGTGRRFSREIEGKLLKMLEEFS
jgi:hypothetical protein